MTSKFFAGRPSGRPTASVRLGRAADAALDQLVLDELGAEPSLLPLGPARLSRVGRSSRTAVIEHLEDRRLMAGDASIVQSLPYTLEFDSQRSGITDKDGEGTGFTCVQPNKLGTEYQPNLIDLDTAAGVLKLTTTGTSTAGSNYNGDNTQVNGLQTQFNATTSGVHDHRRGSSARSATSTTPASRAASIFGPDQDNYVKLVAVAPAQRAVPPVRRRAEGRRHDDLHPPDQLEQLITGIGSFASINTLDLLLAGDAATGTVTRLLPRQRRRLPRSCRRASRSPARARVGVLQRRRPAPGSSRWRRTTCRRSRSRSTASTSAPARRRSSARP